MKVEPLYRPDVTTLTQSWSYIPNWMRNNCKCQSLGSLWNCFCNKIHRLIIFKEFHELMFNSWTFLIPKNTSANSAMFFLTNRSVIFCVVHVRHCELFGSLLSLAISEPRLCCSESLLHCKSPQLYSELSHLYFLRCIFKKIYRPHLYWSLYRDLFIT